MPMFTVRSIAGEWEPGQFIEAADADEAARKWRRLRDLPLDNPIAVHRDPIEYPEDDELPDE